MKYATLDAWASRMIALTGKAAQEGVIPLISLDDLPKEVLDLFGRAILHSEEPGSACLLVCLHMNRVQETSQ